MKVVTIKNFAYYIRRYIAALTVYVLLFALTIVLIVPFLQMLSTSFKPAEEWFSTSLNLIPTKPTLENYEIALSQIPFFRFFLNSSIMTAGVTVGQIIIATLSAYSFSKLRWPGRNLFFWIIVATMMMPAEASLVVRYIMMVRFNWVNTYLALIIPLLGTGFTTFLLRQFFLNVPDELIEAAIIDGCRRIRILFVVVIPLAKAGIATGTIFLALKTWNNFLWPLLVTGTDEMSTLPVGLQKFVETSLGQNYIAWGPFMAMSTLVMAPMIILYLFARKTFIQGISTTGLKE